MKLTNLWQKPRDILNKYQSEFKQANQNLHFNKDYSFLRTQRQRAAVHITAQAEWVRNSSFLSDKCKPGSLQYDTGSGTRL